MEEMIKVETKGSYFDAYEDIASIVEKIINKFGGKELAITDIDFSRFNFIWFTPKTNPHWVAKVIKTPEYYRCLGIKPLTIVCVKQLFEEYNQNIRKAILYHELTHVRFDEQGNYKLIDHDLKDFKFLIEKIGLNYERASEMFGDC